MTTLEKTITPELREKIYAEQICLLYMAPFYRPALHIITFTIYFMIIINHVNHFYAYTWGILLFSLNVFRAIDIYKTKKIINGIKNYKPINIRYAVCAGLLGAIYSFGFVFFFNDLPFVNQIYLIMLISAMVPAGFVSFVSDRLSFNSYSYFLVLPVIFRVLAEGQTDFLNIGICAIIFALIMRSLFTWNYNVLTKAIKLKLENDLLLSSLQTVNARLTELSVIDELTQIANRRSFYDSLEREWSRAKRTGNSISLLMIDIDYFKQYNDEYGHIKGDECLRYIADFLKKNLNRPGDIAARYGGEEFCIIMADTNLSGAIKFAENIHSGIRELKILNPGSEIGKYLTISIGLASVLPAKDESYMDIIYTSDQALYSAKNDGRNLIRTKEVLEKNPEAQLVI